MKSILFFAIIFITGCSAKNRWLQSERDKLINSCKKKAMIAGTENGKNLSAEGEKKLEAYCSCYQQSLEKKYPDVKNLEKVSAGELTKIAQDCMNSNLP
jgi:hypothetical protein